MWYLFNCDFGVFFVADGLQPGYALLAGFGNGDVAHAGVGRSAVPMLNACGTLHYVAGQQYRNGLAPFLRVAHAFGDDERLLAGVNVPVSAGAGSEGY